MWTVPQFGPTALYTPGRSLEFAATFTSVWVPAWRDLPMTSVRPCGRCSAPTPAGHSSHAPLGPGGNSRHATLQAVCSMGRTASASTGRRPESPTSSTGCRLLPHSLAVTNSMRPMVSDFTVGSGGHDGRLDVAGSTRLPIRQLPVTDSGCWKGLSKWTDAAWATWLSSGTSVALSVRTGNTPTPDGTWTNFIPLAYSGAAIGATSRYLQYQATLATTSAEQTPVLQSRDDPVHPQHGSRGPTTTPTAPTRTPRSTLAAAGVLANDTGGNR